MGEGFSYRALEIRERVDTVAAGAWARFEGQPRGEPVVHRGGVPVGKIIGWHRRT